MIIRNDGSINKGLKLFINLIDIFILGSCVCYFMFIFVNDALAKNNFRPPVGLVSWWSLDEIDGLTATDIQNINQGTLMNGALFSTGRFDNAVSLDGVNDYILVADSSTLHITGPITIHTWIKLNSLNKWQYIIIKDSETGNGKFHTYQLSVMPNNQILFCLGDGINPYWGLTSNATLTADTWYQIVAVYDGNDQLLYINGNLDNSVTIGDITLYNHNKPLRIGIVRESGTFYFPFDGLIDEIGLFNCPLSNSVIQSLFISNSVPFFSGNIYTYPNPAKNKINPTFHIEVGYADKIIIDIYNIVGELVHSAEITGNPQNIRGKDVYEYTWNVSDIASGVYIYHIEVEREDFNKIGVTKKLAIIK